MEWRGRGMEEGIVPAAIGDEERGGIGERPAAAGIG
jgi:hypothetical protein